MKLKKTDLLKRLKELPKKGERGKDGEKGEKGEKGDRGEKGEKGDRGIDGKDGLHGINGEDGIDGKNGNDGKDGINGKNGEDGEKGEKGEKGDRGEKGEKGMGGSMGFPGAPGTTIHSALSNLNIDDHTQYALLAGRAGGQILQGDIASGGNLTLSSTNHATKGIIYLGSNHYVNEELGSLYMKSKKSEVTISSEMITNQVNKDFSGACNWTGTNWSISGGAWTHTAGLNSTSLANNFLSEAPVSGSIYCVSMTITTTTAGTISTSIGNYIGTVAGYSTGSESYLMVGEATNTNPLTLTPNATWQGSIDNVSIKKITPMTPAGIVLNSDSTTALEIYPSGGGMFAGYNLLLGEDSGRCLIPTPGTGNTNIAIGYQAGGSLKDNTNTVAIGRRAMYKSAKGNGNIAIGYTSLYNVSGSYNLAVGYNCSTSLTTGTANFAIGSTSLYGCTTGSYNFVLGYEAGKAITTSSNNICMGYKAGDNITTGSSNLIIGHDIDAQSATTNSQLSIGNLILGTGLSATGTTLSTGSIGIGIVPTQRFTLPAGTATAGTAPLKFTAGVLNTTAVIGAVEFTDDGTDGHFYITMNVGGTLTRREFAFV